MPLVGKILVMYIHMYVRVYACVLVHLTSGMNFVGSLY